MTAPLSTPAFRKVTISLRLEIWGDDLDGEVGKLRELAGAIDEVVSEYATATVGVDIAATGEATVTEGWPGADQDGS